MAWKFLDRVALRHEKDIRGFPSTSKSQTNPANTAYRPVRRDAPADLGAAGASGLTSDLQSGEIWAKKWSKGGQVSEKCGGTEAVPVDSTSGGNGFSFQGTGRRATTKLAAWVYKWAHPGMTKMEIPAYVDLDDQTGNLGYRWPA